MTQSFGSQGREDTNAPTAKAGDLPSPEGARGHVLGLYGSDTGAEMISKVGKHKTPFLLVERMPSAEVAAKVGPPAVAGTDTRRVVRRNGGA